MNARKNRSSASDVAAARRADDVAARQEHGADRTAPRGSAEAGSARGLALTPAPRGAPQREPDRVNDASEDSFPASDPPAWAAMRIGPPQSRREP